MTVKTTMTEDSRAILAGNGLPLGMVSFSAECQPEYQPEYQPDYQPEYQPEYQPDCQPEYQPDCQPDYQPDCQPDLCLLDGFRLAQALF